MRRLPVNLDDLETAMQFDPDSHIAESETPYLDLQTGSVLWIWESDEEFADTMNADPEANRRAREALAAEPDRFAPVPGLGVFDNNEMLQEFLDSRWTEDESLRRRAGNAYRGSIGRWKRAIDHDPAIIHAWHASEDKAVRRRALQILAEPSARPGLMRAQPGL